MIWILKMGRTLTVDYVDTEYCKQEEGLFQKQEAFYKGYALEY